MDGYLELCAGNQDLGLVQRLWVCQVGGLLEGCKGMEPTLPKINM